MIREQETAKLVLIAAGDPEVRSHIEAALPCHGYRVEVAHSGEDAARIFAERQRAFSAIVLDTGNIPKDGLETIRKIRLANQHIPVVVIWDGTEPLSVAQVPGATELIAKPVDREKLGNVFKKVLPVNGGTSSTPRKEARWSSSTFLGSSIRIAAIYDDLGQIAWSEEPVLIQGETGTGKGVFAQELHSQSPRRSKPFLKLNCAALPSELIESELFGYEKGAFTGAFQRKPGMFELADGGTILLDEIGDMDCRLQAKLLQVVQDHAFQRLGGKETIHVSVRVISATHRDLDRAIREGTFREDLYYRLNVLSIHLPPLRERQEDILPLAQFLLKKHSPAGTEPVALTPALEELLVSYSWPGNIRELENIIRRVIVLRNLDTVAKDLRTRIGRESAAAPVPPAAPVSAGQCAPPENGNGNGNGKTEAEKILAALQYTRWNRRKAAALLHMEYKALLYRIKKHGLDGSRIFGPQGGPGLPGIIGEQRAEPADAVMSAGNY